MISRLNGQRQLPTTNEIRDYLYCAKCDDSCPSTETLKNWQRLSIGLTSYGLQVWCDRHNVNVLHFDLSGNRVRVNPGITKTRVQ